MPQDQSIPNHPLIASVEDADQAIRETARKAAQRLLQQALEAEIEAHLDAHTEKADETGNRTVVRNGHAPKRTVETGVGTVEIFRPRIDDRKAAKAQPDYKRFASGVLPRFLRRTPTVEGVVAVLYLKGISTNDFDTAFKAIYGESAGALSPATVSRLKQAWEQEHQAWGKERLSSSHYAHIWADGVYFNARVEKERNWLEGTPS